MESNAKLPATLKEFIKIEDTSEFKLAIGHFVELAHNLMGSFPAIESQSKEMVMTTNLELLVRVCATLTARRLKFGTQLLYINPETGMAYSLLGTDECSLKRSTPFQTLTQSRFDELMKDGQPAFKWAPGLVGDDISGQKFLEALDTAAKEAK